MKNPILPQNLRSARDALLLYSSTLTFQPNTAVGGALKAAVSESKQTKKLALIKFDTGGENLLKKVR